MATKKLAGVVAGLVLAMAVAGCGDDDDASDADGSSGDLTRRDRASPR